MPSRRLVYIKSRNHAWVPAILEKQTKDVAIVSIPEFQSEQAMISGDLTDCKTRGLVEKEHIHEVKLKDYKPNNELPLQNVDAHGKFTHVADMVDLKFLHEAAILYNLKARHIESLPYTRTGSVMIAVNPYQWFPKLYTTDKQDYYAKRLIWEPHAENEISSDPLDTLKPKREMDDVDPHVYEISALAYRGLAWDGFPQSILVSGESGAGKTETVKICMNHLARIPLACGQNAGSSHEQDDFASDSTFQHKVVQRVLDSNPLLEAFGNAKTRRNDNSSRFGKYIQLQFHRPLSYDAAAASTLPKCTLSGSSCQVYLLEKNRVAHHDANFERTFHIFYQLLAAPNDEKIKFWSKLENKHPSNFRYVGKNDTDTIDGKTDKEKFKNTINALELIGLVGEELKHMMQAICIVLQAGNIVFSESPKSSDACYINSRFRPALEELASDELLGISCEDLESVLTFRTVTVNNEATKVPLRRDVAKEYCDAFAKHLYECVFLWLVNAINKATCATKRNGREVKRENLGVIGLLDIFGFEHLGVNSLEQLCINYANEMLQFKFTHDVFQSVYLEYTEEGLSLDQVAFDDNTDVLDLIQTPHTGLLSVLNEECVLPKGNDSAFCRKAIASARKANNNSVFVLPHFQDYEFGIHHYGGDVTYDATNFVTKNQDTLPTDLVECVVAKSINPIVKETLFPRTAAGINAMFGSQKQANQGHGLRRGSITRRAKANYSRTVWTKYSKQLNELMANLHQSKSRYIRCIKPNADKAPVSMDHDLTLDQLRSAGVIAAVTMSRAAFPNRLEHEQVVTRFESTWRYFLCNYHNYELPVKSKIYSKPEYYKETCENLLTVALQDMQQLQLNNETRACEKGFAVGQSKVYFVAGALEYLESQRHIAMELCVLILQRVGRGFLDRKNSHAGLLRRRTQSRIKLQCWWRCLQAKKKLSALQLEEKMRISRIRLQNWWRTIHAVKTLYALRYTATSIKIQSWCRMVFAKKLAKSIREKAKQDAIERKRAKILKRLQKRSAIKIQALVRGVVCREILARERALQEKMLAVYEDVVDLNDEVEELEQKLMIIDQERIDQVNNSQENELRMMEQSFEKLQDYVNGSDSSLNNSNGSFRGGLFSSDDQIGKIRQENREMREDIVQMESQENALKKNIKRIWETNEKANDAVIEAKKHHLRLVVKNEVAKQAMTSADWENRKVKRLISTRQNQFRVEQTNRQAYLNTIQEVVGLVKDRKTKKSLAAEIEHRATKAIVDESRKYKSLGPRQNSITSFTASETSVTTSSDHFSNGSGGEGSDLDGDGEEYFP